MDIKKKENLMTKSIKTVNNEIVRKFRETTLQNIPQKTPQK